MSGKDVADLNLEKRKKKRRKRKKKRERKKERIEKKSSGNFVGNN